MIDEKKNPNVRYKAVGAEVAVTAPSTWFECLFLSSELYNLMAMYGGSKEEDQGCELDPV